MLSIDCEKCDGRCCTSRIRKLFVVLTPQEAGQFKDFSTTLRTDHDELVVLKKDDSGNCIFYDEQKNLCRSYSNRPFECRMYPCAIFFDKEVTFKIDSKVCPKTQDCSAEELEGIKKMWLEQGLPLSWIKAYSEFD